MAEHRHDRADGWAPAPAPGRPAPADWPDTRYSRQEAMPQIGSDGQARLSAARVVSIGAGGVKSPVLYYLAAAGIGALRIIDHDHVELSNLNRQILYTTRDIGHPKATAAARRLAELNPDISIEAIAERAGPDTLPQLVDGFDVIYEGADSVEGRYVVSDHCARTGTPMIHVSAQYGYGHLFTYLPGRSACLRCVFPDLPSGHGGPVPVLGCAAGIAGSLGAMEAIKLITGQGKLIRDGYLTFSGFCGDFQFLPVRRRSGCVCHAEPRGE